MGEAGIGGLRVRFDGKVKLEFHGARVSSDGGLLAYRELDEALGLTAIAEGRLQDWRTGQNTQRTMTALFRQSVFSRLTGSLFLSRWSPAILRKMAADVRRQRSIWEIPAKR